MSEREEGRGIKARGDKTGSDVPAITRGPGGGVAIQGRGEGSGNGEEDGLEVF